MPYKKVIKILKKNGFILDRSKGSHYIFIHANYSSKFIVPIHSKEVSKYILKDNAKAFDGLNLPF